MLVEVILELLVGIIDAELFKTVPLEILKPKDVKDPDGQALGKQRKQVLPLGPCSGAPVRSCPEGPVFGCMLCYRCLGTCNI